jgi:hypothetical protein
MSSGLRERHPLLAEQGGLAGVGQLQAEQEPGDGGLARAGLADQPQRPTRAEREGHVVGGDDLAPTDLKHLGEPPGLKEHVAERRPGRLMDGCAATTPPFDHGGGSSSRGRQGGVSGAACRDGGHQLAGVRVAGALEHLRRCALLDDDAVGHDEHPVGDAQHHRQVVADQQHPGAVVAQLPQQPEHARLDRLVECGGGLVGDDQARLAGDPRGDEGALPLPAGELPGPLAGPQLGVRQAHALEELDGARAARGGVEPGVQGERVADLAADRPQGVQRDQRVLRDQADGAAAQPAQAPPGQREHVLPVHAELRGRDLRPLPGQTDDAARGHALARARLADDRHALPRRDLEADAVDHPAHATAPGPAAVRKGDDQVPDAQHRLGRGSGLGGLGHTALLFRFWMPRPITVAAAALATIARPGKNVIHQKFAM